MNVNAAYWKRTYGRRALSEAAWAIGGFPLAIAGFAFVAGATALSLGLAFLIVGIPLMAMVLWGCRHVGHGYRMLARRVLDLDVAEPVGRSHKEGVIGWTISTLKDPVAWRSWAYLVVRYPLGVISFFVTTNAWGYAIGMLTAPAWLWLIDQRNVHNGVPHATSFGPIPFGGPASGVAAFGIGCILLLVAPWLVHGVVWVEKWLAQALLGPTKSSLRVQTLESTRATAVEDASATLRRIERDLHDGTQAQLVALAMQLGMAKEELATAPTQENLDAVRARVDAAHAAAKDALGDLRDIVRGIHPPVLDTGLDAALATLVARNPIPVDLRVDLSVRPAPAIESIAYYAVAELISNATRHGGAPSVIVEVGPIGEGTIRLAVSDSGVGGARFVERATPEGSGTGLVGLRDRVAAVDGRVRIDSPLGGPTMITVELPTHP